MNDAVPLIVPIGRAAMAVADPAQHQIVLLDRTGEAVARIGSGIAGPGDGPWGGARFDGPRGVAADAAALWVADTGNHLLRRIDLAGFMVTTVAGVGRPGPALTDPLPGPLAALSAPERISCDGRAVTIFNAGTGQSVAYDLAWGMVRPLP